MKTNNNPFLVDSVTIKQADNGMFMCDIDGIKIYRISREELIEFMSKALCKTDKDFGEFYGDGNSFCHKLKNFDRVLATDEKMYVRAIRAGEIMKMLYINKAFRIILRKTHPSKHSSGYTNIINDMNKIFFHFGNTDKSDAPFYRIKLTNTKAELYKCFIDKKFDGGNQLFCEVFADDIKAILNNSEDYFDNKFIAQSTNRLVCQPIIQTPIAYNYLYSFFKAWTIERDIYDNFEKKVIDILFKENKILSADKKVDFV